MGGGNARLCARRLAKSYLTLAIEAPTTSILFKSRVPSPTSSPSFRVLSQSSKGGDPRSPMGSKPITASVTASVQIGFRPATITPGLAAWMGLADTMSVTTRGTRYVPTRGVLLSFSCGALLEGCRWP